LLAVSLSDTDNVSAVQTPGGHQTELNLRPVTELRIRCTISYSAKFKILQVFQM